MTSKLCLGTAKIGMPDYGYSNTDTLVNADEFLFESLSLGINYIDTSPRYGGSEKIVGNILKTLDNKPGISTKVDNLIPGSKQNSDLMLHSILSSIDNLSIDSIDICYLHQNEIDIISDVYVHKGIELLKEKNLIKEIGTSIYSESELRYTLESGIFDWVQIPINILDTSFYNIISEYNTNIKVSARSVFLQGILLNRHSICDDIEEHSELLDALELVDRLCVKHNINIKQLSIAYLSLLERIDQIIVGTTSINNLKDNILSTDIVLSNNLITSLKTISKQPKVWTNPRKWKS
ncbi:aldo/keto reductase [bacterium]|jgi:uncharacterized protein|nr:aldo/keto reductase [bacterium]